MKIFYSPFPIPRSPITLNYYPPPPEFFASYKVHEFILSCFGLCKIDFKTAHKAIIFCYSNIMRFLIKEEIIANSCQGQLQKTVTRDEGLEKVKVEGEGEERREFEFRVCCREKR